MSRVDSDDKRYEWVELSAGFLIAIVKRMEKVLDKNLIFHIYRDNNIKQEDLARGGAVW